MEEPKKLTKSHIALVFAVAIMLLLVGVPFWAALGIMILLVVIDFFFQEMIKNRNKNKE